MRLDQYSNNMVFLGFGGMSGSEIRDVILILEVEVMKKNSTYNFKFSAIS